MQNLAAERITNAARAGSRSSQRSGRLVLEALPAPPELQIQLPPLLRFDELAPSAAHLVLRLNRIGAARPDPVLASMYRSLAHWTGYLALAWVLLAPLEASGALAAAIDGTLVQAQAKAAVIAARAPPRAVLVPELHPAASQAIERFTTDAIARMLVICGVLGHAGVGT